MKKNVFIICVLSSSLPLFAIKYRFENRTHRSLEPDKFAFWAISTNAPPYLLVVVDPSSHASVELPGDKVRIVYVIRDSFMQKAGNYTKKGAQAFEKAIVTYGHQGKDWEKFGMHRSLKIAKNPRHDIYIYGPKHRNKKGTFTLSHYRKH
jgi:hypothetical protein